MGVEAQSSEKMVAFVKCQGDCEKAKTDYQNKIQMKPKNKEPEKKEEGMILGGL